jgi:hypothetical protein
MLPIMPGIATSPTIAPVYVQRPNHSTLNKLNVLFT